MKSIYAYMTGNELRKLVETTGEIAIHTCDFTRRRYLDLTSRNSWTQDCGAGETTLEDAQQQGGAYRVVIPRKKGIQWPALGKAIGMTKEETAAFGRVIERDYGAAPRQWFICMRPIKIAKYPIQKWNGSQWVDTTLDAVCGGIRTVDDFVQAALQTKSVATDALTGIPMDAADKLARLYMKQAFRSKRKAEIQETLQVLRAWMAIKLHNEYKDVDWAWRKGDDDLPRVYSAGAICSMLSMIIERMMYKKIDDPDNSLEHCMATIYYADMTDGKPDIRRLLMSHALEIGDQTDDAVKRGDCDDDSDEMITFRLTNKYCAA